LIATWDSPSTAGASGDAAAELADDDDWVVDDEVAD
jgi:hypothetical protein